MRRVGLIISSSGVVVLTTLKAEERYILVIYHSRACPLCVCCLQRTFCCLLLEA
jgi:hypothetical protein